VQQLAVGGNRLRAGDLVRAVDVGLADLVVADGDDPLRRHRANMLAGDAGIDIRDLRACHALGVLQRLADGACGLLDVGDDAAPHAGGTGLANAEHLDRRATLRGAHHLADDGGGASGPDVESGDETVRVHGSLAITWSR